MPWGSPSAVGLKQSCLWLRPVGVSVQGLQSVMIQSLTKRSQRGFGSCGLLRAPPLCGEAPLGLQRSIEALMCGILGPFWASCPGRVPIPPRPCPRTRWPILQPGESRVNPSGCLLPHLALVSLHPWVIALLWSPRNCCLLCSIPLGLP